MRMDVTLVLDPEHLALVAEALNEFLECDRWDEFDHEKALWLHGVLAGFVRDSHE